MLTSWVSSNALYLETHDFQMQGIFLHGGRGCTSQGSYIVDMQVTRSLITLTIWTLQLSA